MALFINGRNITRDPIATFLVARPDHLMAYGQFGANWTMGIEGRF